MVGQRLAGKKTRAGVMSGQAGWRGAMRCRAGNGRWRGGNTGGMPMLRERAVAVAKASCNMGARWSRFKVREVLGAVMAGGWVGQCSVQLMRSLAWHNRGGGPGLAGVAEWVDDVHG